jgi:acyl carrier protein
MDDIDTTIKAYILEQFLPEANPDELTVTTPLIAGGILDSIATMRLVAFLEDRFAIEVHAPEVNADNLDSIERVARLVRRKLTAGR